MVKHDSLGVPLEPNFQEPTPVLRDMYGVAIYRNETYYISADGILASKSLKRYGREYVDELTAGEADEELQEVMSRSEYEELIKSALFDWFSDNGFVKPFDMQMEVAL